MYPMEFLEGILIRITGYNRESKDPRRIYVRLPLST
jgi:hypothetical protein